MPRLPPLNALRAFEAAARHGGFIGAADELFVTRGAISRHVKLLEDHLGTALFIRQAQGVRLTDAGAQLLPILTDAFGRIARGADRLTDEAAELRVICPPGTSIRWLLPRLDTFHQRHPDIRLRLTTDFYTDLGFDPGTSDVGFSVTNWPNRAPDLTRQTLFPALLTPVCTPDYAAKMGLETPADLARCELLHETRIHTDWTDWVTHAQLNALDPTSGQIFANIDLSIKAASMGLGVAIADLVLCRAELAAGTLIAPFPEIIVPSPLGGICVLTETARLTEPKIATFLAWVDAAAAPDRNWTAEIAEADRLTA